MKKTIQVLLVIALAISFLMYSQVYAQAKSVTLVWTAPADDAGLPTQKAVTLYRLVYANAPITEATFSAATTLTTGTPKAPGATETYTYDLPDNKTYYFAIKSVDAAGNVSAISNVPSLDFLFPTAVTDLRVSSP
jgi:hypothetical protein